MRVLWHLKTRRESCSSEINVRTRTRWKCYSDRGVRNKRIQWDSTFSTRQAPEGSSALAKGRKVRVREVTGTPDWGILRQNLFMKKIHLESNRHKQL